MFAATDEREVNARVAHDARMSGALVSCADDPQLSDFLVPATLDRDGIQVALSTGGRSPALARQLRDDLDAWLTPERAELLDLVADVRDELKGRGCNPDGAAWRDALDSQLLALLAQGQRTAARRLILDRLVLDPLAKAH
ncbi:MAG: hypothetical protein L0221_13030 [Chloroflexi bacterium]|nr:hypothetical protein [Chloroflexota bacterium]